MTKSTITRERLEQLANFKGAPVTRQEEQELARMALATMDSEPVAWRQPFTGRCVSSIFYQDGSSPLDHGYEPLYSAPPEPVAAPSGYRLLAAAPQSPGSEPATVPGKWIPVSERMPERGDYLVTDGCDFDVQLFNGEQFIPSFVWEDKITHWMPLPAAPQEVKGE